MSYLPIADYSSGDTSIDTIKPPPFEGCEKRLVVTYDHTQFSNNFNSFTLHDIPREELDCLMELCKCKILSQTDSSMGVDLDNDIQGRPIGYLLSESSLFIWKYRMEIKTCGTTVPLLALQGFHDVIVKKLQQRQILGKEVEPKDLISSVQFSRLDFLFPTQQVYPHRDFCEETSFLYKFFPENSTHRELPGIERCYYFFEYVGKEYENSAPFSLSECILTGIDSNCQEPFVGKTRQLQTEESGLLRAIDVLTSDSKTVSLDQYWFSPYGYSCNGVVEKNTIIDVHIAPEPEVSYASIEVSSPINTLCANSIFSLIYEGFRPKIVDLVGFTTDLAVMPNFLTVLENMKCQGRIQDITTCKLKSTFVYHVSVRLGGEASIAQIPLLSTNKSIDWQSENDMGSVLALGTYANEFGDTPCGKQGRFNQDDFVEESTTSTRDFSARSSFGSFSLSAASHGEENLCAVELC